MVGEHELLLLQQLLLHIHQPGCHLVRRADVSWVVKVTGDGLLASLHADGECTSTPVPTARQVCVRVCPIFTRHDNVASMGPWSLCSPLRRGTNAGVVRQSQIYAGDDESSPFMILVDRGGPVGSRTEGGQRVKGGMLPQSQPLWPTQCSEFFFVLAR